MSLLPGCRIDSDHLIRVPLLGVFCVSAVAYDGIEEYRVVAYNKSRIQNNRYWIYQGYTLKPIYVLQ